MPDWIVRLVDDTSPAPAIGMGLRLSAPRKPGYPFRVEAVPLTTAGTYQHSQGEAGATWTVNHNLGFKPSVRAYSVGGREMLVEVVHVSDNQTLIYFDTPVAGYAVCT